MPDMFIAIKIGKEHFDKTEMKDWVFKSLIDELTIHFSNYASSAAFPEFTLSISSTLWKFKKKCTNPIYCKIIGALLEWVKENAWIVKEKRGKQDKEIKVESKLRIEAENIMKKR